MKGDRVLRRSNTKWKEGVDTRFLKVFVGVCTMHDRSSNDPSLFV